MEFEIQKLQLESIKFEETYLSEKFSVIFTFEVYGYEFEFNINQVPHTGHIEILITYAGCNDDVHQLNTKDRNKLKRFLNKHYLVLMEMLFKHPDVRFKALPYKQKLDSIIKDNITN